MLEIGLEIYCECDDSRANLLTHEGFFPVAEKSKIDLRNCSSGYGTASRKSR